MTRKEYAAAVKHVLPPEAFKPAYYKLIYMFGCVAICIGLMWWIRILDNYWAIAGIAMVIGTVYSMIFMFSHELSHNTIIKTNSLRNPLEIFFWGINYFPATLWRRIHHHNHHINTNTLNDPDRRPTKSERSFMGVIFNTLTYPNKVLKYSLTVGLAMPTYTWKHIMSVYYPKGKKPDLVLYRPNYSDEEKKNIAIEILVIVLIQALIFLLIGSALKYLLVTALSWYVGSLFTVTVIMTQHYLKDVTLSEADQLLSTTTTEVPQIMHFLMDYHAYHVEHHVIPSVNFDYYPLVAAELKRQFPDRYHSLPFHIAVKEAFQYEVFVDDPLL